MLPVETPYKVYNDSDGAPLDDGYVYFGTAGANPITSPVTVYWDAAGTQPASQPLRTVNGYIMRSGSPANVFHSGAYSEIVRDSRGVTIFYAPTSADFSVATYVDTAIAAIQAIVDGLSAAGGAALIGYKNTNLANSVLGTLAGRIYDINAVADFNADPTGLTDSTVALTRFFTAMYNGCNALLPPGLYLYTPIIALNTGVGYLNMVDLIGANLFGYGAVIRNNAQVTVAQATSGTLYGVKLQNCTDCSVQGLKFDGNRDITFGTNVDGNEFYSGFYIYGCTRARLINCIGVNCQGDGVSTNRIGAATTFNNDCAIIGGYFGGNRRNEISIGGDYGMTIDGGVTLFGSSDAHRTNPKAGIDLEWEHATIGPTGNNTRTYIGSVSMSGTMAGGGLYIPRNSGVTVNGMHTYGIITSVSIDNTATGSYETQNINIGAGCSFDSTYGIAINGGANIHVAGAKIKATYPIIVDSPLSAAPVGWVADINGCHIEGESVFAVKVLRGRTKFTNNMCINCSSSGGNNYFALFVPQCEVKGNTFTRDTNQTDPGYGLIFASALSVIAGNTISDRGTTAHPFSFGQNSVTCYPAVQNNIRNGGAMNDTVATKQITTRPIDTSVSTPQALYVPFFGDNSEITSMLLSVAVAGTNVVSTTTMTIGIVGDYSKYLNPAFVTLWDLGDVTDIAGVLTSVNTTYAGPVFVKVTPGNNLPHLQFTITLRTNRASLYTSSVLFS